MDQVSVPVVILITLLVINADGSRFFHNGIERGGNLQLHIKPKLGESPKNFTRWFNQRLNHFDVVNSATWQQRYYVNDEFLNQANRNVAFLMISGEKEATNATMTRGSWVEYANQTNAILFQLEHRFYGESHPTKDLSVENLKYLTSEQALADIATFVDAMNNEYKLSKKVKWVAFGGSYAGSLAAWARLKYPHLIHGSVCSSAPMLAIPNFQDYLGVVADDLRDTNEECYRAVKVGTAQIESLLQNRVGRRTLTSLFQLCSPLEDSIENKDDISIFFGNLAANFGIIAQYNNIFSIEGNSSKKLNLDILCSVMTNTSIKQEIDRLAEVNSLNSRAFNRSCSFFNYTALMEDLKYTSWEDSDESRQWKFQRCNEFGSYQTTDKKPQIFGDKLPFEWYNKQCSEVFGSRFDANYLKYATRRINTIYGGYDIEVSNVLFVYASLDAWSALGIKSSQSPNVSVIFINGTGHGAEMRSSAIDDLPQLKAARSKIGRIIKSWIK